MTSVRCQALPKNELVFGTVKTSERGTRDAPGSRDWRERSGLETGW